MVDFVISEFSFSVAVEPLRVEPFSISLSTISSEQGTDIGLASFEVIFLDTESISLFSFDDFCFSLLVVFSEDSFNEFSFSVVLSSFSLELSSRGIK